MGNKEYTGSWVIRILSGPVFIVDYVLVGIVPKVGKMLRSVTSALKEIFQGAVYASPTIVPRIGFRQPMPPLTWQGKKK